MGRRVRRGDESTARHPGEARPQRSWTLFWESKRTQLRHPRVWPRILPGTRDEESILGELVRPVAADAGFVLHVRPPTPLSPARRRSHRLHDAHRRKPSRFEWQPHVRTRHQEAARGDSEARRQGDRRRPEAFRDGTHCRRARVHQARHGRTLPVGPSARSDRRGRGPREACRTHQECRSHGRDRQVVPTRADRRSDRRSRRHGQAART